MKTHTTCLFLLVAACGGLIAGPSTAVAADTAARMYRVHCVELNGSPEIGPGTSRARVRQLIGSPNEQLTPDLWLYRTFRSGRDDVAKDASSGLVIGFTGDHVSSLHLLNDGARKAIIARVKAGQVANEVALAAIPEMPTGTAVAAK